MKILIELPTWIGDTVMATPAIENIISYYNNPDITLVGSISSIGVLKNHLQVINTEILDKKYTSLFKLAKNLDKFDVFFSFRSSFRSKILKLLVTSVDKYQYGNNKFLNFHQVEKYNNFINESLNTDFSAGKLNIVIGKSIKTETIPVKKEKLTLGFNPGAAYGDSKCWYPEEFIKVGVQLSSKYNIIIFGGANEKEVAVNIEKGLIEKGVTNYQNLAGNTSVEELIYHISTLDMFVTGDTGPMHLAATFQIPTVAIFGPTKVNETSQWMNDKSIIVKRNLDCQPCMKRTCPLKHHDCMSLIKAKEVLDAIKSLSSESLNTN
jgi:heptosyltransferase II